MLGAEDSTGSLRTSISLFFALRGNFDRHPRIARWTLPLWLYVSVSGVVIYILGFHIYKPEM